MGDGGNIYFIERREPRTKEPRGFYFYTHWTGSQLPRIVQQALDVGRPRWKHASYLARILFDTLTGLEGGELGYGISTIAIENHHPIVVVDPGKTTIGFAQEHEVPKCYASYSFEAFLKKRSFPAFSDPPYLRSLP